LVLLDCRDVRERELVAVIGAVRTRYPTLTKTDAAFPVRTFPWMK
jgi:hypothetical protein